METKVTTSYTTGTTISLDATSALTFFENLAITTIMQCREMKSEEYKGFLRSESKMPHFDALIKKYCAGVHGAVVSNMLHQNASVLYAFVQDCVLNETVAGLYLMRTVTNEGEAAYKLITLALKECEKLFETQFDILGKKMPSDFPKYCEYNERFEEMFK